EGVGGSGSLICHCDQLPLTLTAFANWPFSTLYCTATTAACGLVADPVNRKSTGSSPATIGEGNGPTLTVGATAGGSRTTNVVVTLKVSKSGSFGATRNLKVA